MHKHNNYIISNDELMLIEAVREHAKQARSLPKMDVFKACELVQFDIELVTPDILSILYDRCPKLLGVQPIFFQLGPLNFHGTRNG